jgi:hypothetical protein
MSPKVNVYRWRTQESSSAFTAGPWLEMDEITECFLYDDAGPWLEMDETT